MHLAFRRHLDSSKLEHLKNINPFDMEITYSTFVLNFFFLFEMFSKNNFLLIEKFNGITFIQNISNFFMYHNFFFFNFDW